MAAFVAVLMVRSAEASGRVRACDPEPTEMMISYGDLVTCAIEVTGDTDVFRFAGSTGEVVSIRSGATISLFDPQGNTINLSYPLNSARLPAAGTYTIQVTGPPLGAYYALSLERITPPSPSATSLAFGQNLGGNIDPAWETDLFYFSGAVGEKVIIAMCKTLGDGWSQMELFDSEGTRLAGGYHPISVRLEQQLTKSGTHAIRVTEGFTGDRTMTYRISMQRVAPPSPAATSIRFGQNLAGKIDPAGSMDAFVFVGAAGSTVTVTVSKTAGDGWPQVELFDAEGIKLVGNYSPTSVRLEQRLQKTGAHSVLVSEGFQGDRTFEYRVDVQCVGQCTPELTVPAITSESPLPNATTGTAYSHTLAATGGTAPYRWSVSGGSLPPGLALNAFTGALSGTPSSPGTFSFTVEVTDAAGSKATKQFTLTVVGLSLSLGRTSLIFTCLVGDPLLAAQPVSVSSGSSSLSFTAAASTTSGGNWLLVNPTSGTTPATLSVLVNPAGLAVGIYWGTVTVTASGATNSPQRVEVQLFVNRPEGPPQVFSLVNGASMKGGAVAPGEVVTFFGSNLGPASLMNLQLNEAGQVATTLGEVQVLFDNIPAPLLYVQANQLSAIVPYAVAGTTQAKVEVQYKGAKSNAVVAQVAASAPGVFTIDSSGKGQGAILNQNYSVNSGANPAEKGSVVILYGTGEGETDPQVADGRLVSVSELPKPKLPVSVKIGGVEAEVLYAGGAPGSVAGLLQVNVRVPASVATGNAAPVVLTIGGKSSQEGVTVAVR